MRLVAGPEDELADAVRPARREAEASFGDGTVFAERWLAAPRHIEVQIVADRHGTVIHLGERECSIQRRHQKLIEEAPSPAVDDDLREQLGVAAVGPGPGHRLRQRGHRRVPARRPHRRVLLPRDEHPDPGRAPGDRGGHRLRPGAAADPARPGRARSSGPRTTSSIDGHAIEVRLYAEDPARDWLPGAGTVHRFDDDHADDDVEFLVVDRGVTTGSIVGSEFDPLLAKVVARGPTRDIAIGRLVRYLRRLELHGVTTNRDYLLAVLAAPRLPSRAAPPPCSWPTTRPCSTPVPTPRPSPPTSPATALACAALDRDARPWAFAPDGWRNVGAAAARHDRFAWRDAVIDVVTSPRADDRYRFVIDGLTAEALTVDGRLLDAAPDHVVVELDGVARRYGVNHVGDTWYVNSSLGQTDLVEPARASPRRRPPPTTGGPTAPVPGRIVSVAGRRRGRGRAPARSSSSSRP